MSTEFFNDQWRIPSNENQNKISNYSMEFDGASTTNVNVGNLSAIQGTSTFSMSAWVNLDNTGQQRIFGSWEASVSKRIVGFGIYTGSRLLLQVSDDGVSFDQLFSTSTLTANTWTHVVVTFSNGVANFYINGASAGSDTSTTVTNIYNVSNDYFIGSFQSSTTIPFGGKMDQLTIFDYALSQDQVTQLGAQGYAFASGGSLSGSIDLANPVALGTNKTVSFWFKLSSSGNFSFSPFTSIVNGGNCYYPYFLNSSSTYKWYVSDSGCGGTGSVNVGSGGTVERNKWVHAAVVGDGSNVECYINGLSVAPITPKPDRNPTIQRLFTGMTQLIEFSNFSIFNTNLPETGTESISSLYNNGNPPDLTNYSNIIHWWKLDDADTFDGTDWTVTDYIGSNTGTSNGMNASNLVSSNINGELIANPMITSPKPISYYQLGDQSVDNGANYLVPNNSLSDYVFDFDGAQSISSTIGELTTATDITISCWVKINSTQSGNPRFFTLSESSYPGTNGVTLLALYNSSLNQFYFSFGTGVQYISSSFSQPTNTWHSIIITYGASAGQVYLNGVSVGLSVPASTLNLTNALKLNSNNTLDGELSNVSIFNSRLSSSQIAAVYNNGVPNDISSLSPTAWYKLNASEIFNSTSTEWSIDNNAYPSVYNSSLNFDGSNDSVDCGNDSSLDITGALSISFWIYGETNLAHKGIVSKCPNSGSIPTVAQYHIQYQTNNTLRFVLRNFDLYTGQETTGTVPTVDLNTWQHITMTWNGTNTMTVYKNGLPVCTKVQATTNVSNASPVLLGERAIGGFLNGKLSNTAIWNTELNSTQITTLYNNGTPASDISSLSPVSWWKLDNTTTGLLDSGSASNNGTNSGATKYAGFVNALAGESSGMDSSNLVVSDLQQTSGYSPYALDFSGITAYLKTYTTPAATNTVTLSAWVKRTGASGNLAGVFGVRNSGGDPAYGICWDLAFSGTTNKIEFRVSETDGSAYIQSTSNVALTDNTWTHVVGVADGTNVKLYINGVLQTDVESYNGTLRAPTSNIFFAGQGPGGGNPFNGQLSNCARWNVGLTQAQVTEIYNQGVPSNLNTFSGTAPIGWWQIGSNSSFEGDDWTCLDEIGTDYADSGTTAMTNDDIVDGPGYSASGLGSSTIDIKGDAPYSTANGLSENMDVLDRVSGTGNVPS